MIRCTLRTALAEVTFEYAGDTTLLDAAAAAGWELPHSCLKGVCEGCRARIVRGEVWPAADSDGTALLCQARPLGDVEIAPLRMERRRSGSAQEVLARVFRVEWPDRDVAIVDLRFAAGVRVPFRAGQYLQLLLPGLSPRCFSMANPPRHNDGVQLHVRVVPGGHFGMHVLPTLKKGDELTVSLPWGDFHLRDAPGRPAVLVAGGTGFAPMQALLEEALPRCPDRPFSLYWGSRRASGLYALATVAKWQRRFPNFRFHGVLSEDAGGTLYRAGLVHEAVLADFDDLSGVDVYVCGTPALVCAARDEFVSKRGLRPESFYCDSFVVSGA